MTLRLVVLLMIFITACEQIDLIEEEIPFQELIVVNGFLVGATEEISVTVTKSFPIDFNQPREDVSIDSLNIYISAEDQGIWPLVAEREGIYQPLDELIVKTGLLYKLNIAAGSRRIHAETFVPPVPVVEEIKINDRFIDCTLKNSDGTAFGCKFIVKSKLVGNVDIRQFIFEEIVNEPTESTGTIIVKSAELPQEYLSDPDNFSVSLEIYAFDKLYKNYYDTRSNNKPIENIFSEGGGSVHWNVVGEDVIGLFIGYTKKLVTDIK